MAATDLRLGPTSVDVSTDDAGHPVLTVVLPESRSVTWTYTVEWIGGQPHFLRLSFDATDPARHPVAQQAQTFTVPWTRLVGIWRIMFNRHADGTAREEASNLWDVLKSPERLSLGKRPRMKKGKSTEDYHREMVNWTEPVAATILTAYTAAVPVQKYVAERFGFGVDRAKQVIETARQFHPYLPKQPRHNEKETPQ